MRIKISSFKPILMIIFLFITNVLFAQEGQIGDSIPGMRLVWHDEFDVDGKPDPNVWSYEKGFVRNGELQWYQPDNAICQDGLLVITARHQTIENPHYDSLSGNWKLNRKFAYYTSASLKTKGTQEWQFGRIEVRAKIDTTVGSWPAIWTLGVEGSWPACGEVDVMEFYRISGSPTILANVAWADKEPWKAVWDSEKIPLSYFISKDQDWPNKFHIWRMDWNADVIQLYLDNELLNFKKLDDTVNAGGNHPFLQPHYLLLNLAIGANGGEPDPADFPISYVVDYVRVYERK